MTSAARTLRSLATRCAASPPFGAAVRLADRILPAREGRADLPPRAVLLTFDDAYDDFAEVAWPLLRHHGLPATLFVPTAYPDVPGRAFWWDRLHQAVAGARASSVATPVGRLPLSSAAERDAAA